VELDEPVDRSRVVPFPRHIAETLVVVAGELDAQGSYMLQVRKDLQLFESIGDLPELGRVVEVFQPLAVYILAGQSPVKGLEARKDALLKPICGTGAVGVLGFREGGLGGVCRQRVRGWHVDC